MKEFFLIKTVEEKTYRNIIVLNKYLKLHCVEEGLDGICVALLDQQVEFTGGHYSIDSMV